MKSLKLLLSMFLLFFAEIGFSQNYVTYTPLSQNVSTTSGTEISVNVVAKCYGSTSNTVLINPTYCIWDSGLTNISFSNGTYLTPGQSSTITFKFKKTVSTSSSFTYKFSTNSSCNQADSDMIKITVNYSSTGTITCNLPPPSNLIASNVGLNSFQCNWNKRTTLPSGTTPYILQYKKSADTNWTFYQGQITYNLTTCSAIINGLNSDTYYQWRVFDYCSSSQGNGGVESNIITTKTNSCPILPSSVENLSIVPYSYGYKVEFTPIVNAQYILEYVDLVTNSGSAIGQFNLLPEGASYPNFYYIQAGHSFKIRIIAYSECASTYSSWITVNASCPSAPIGLHVYSDASSGTFSWDSVANSQNYQGEFLIYNVAGQNTSGTFNSSTNSYSTTIGTNEISGNKFIKFRMKSQCSNGTWSDYSDWSTTAVWNN